MFNIVTGVLRPQHGRVSFGGMRIERLRPHRIVRLGVARTFQTTRLFPSLTVLQNVLLAAPSRAEKRNRTKALAQLDLVGIAHLEDRPAEALSFGQQRLVEFARALMADPRLILLDEPFAGLAPAILDQLAGLVSAMPRRGVAVLLIEHNLEVALGLATKVFVLDRGRLIAEGTADEVRASPAVIDAYLGAPGAFFGDGRCSSGLTACAPATAGSKSCTRCRCGSRRARWSPSSAPTAPARACC